VLDLDVPVHGDSPVTLSEPFEIAGSTMPVEITARADVDQAWIGLDVALIHDESGESDAVGFELSRYHGYEDGESWSEGSSSGSAVVGRVRPGSYVLRAEPQTQKDATGILPETVHVRVVQGVFLWAPFLLALLLLYAWPLLATYQQSQFEKRRWAESDLRPSNSEADDE
jgi:hypothetical protein